MGSVRVFWPKHNTGSLVAALQAKAGALKEALPVSLVVLFGSYAKGNFTAASDIDILVVYKGEPRRDAYNIVCNTIDLPRLEPHVYSEAEYVTMEKTIARMIRDGKTIYEERTP